MHPYAYAQCPLGRASTELLRDSVYNYVLSHSLASKVFNNLEVLTELLIPVPVSQHILV
jgi:hypothetical protein